MSKRIKIILDMDGPLGDITKLYLNILSEHRFEEKEKELNKTQIFELVNKLREKKKEDLKNKSAPKGYGYVGYFFDMEGTEHKKVTSLIDRTLEDPEFRTRMERALEEHFMSNYHILNALKILTEIGDVHIFTNAPKSLAYITKKVIERLTGVKLHEPVGSTSNMGIDRLVLFKPYVALAQYSNLFNNAHIIHITDNDKPLPEELLEKLNATYEYHGNVYHHNLYEKALEIKRRLK